MGVILNPSEEGITHINVYSKSNLEIGRMLSNFYRFEIVTEDGVFQSVEAYWHYLGVNPNNESRDLLKNMYGFEAKNFGQELRKKDGIRIDQDEFQRKISDAIFYKFVANKYMLLENEKFISLPLEHYYNFDGRIVDVKDKYKWMIDNIYYIRGFIVDNLI